MRSSEVIKMLEAAGFVRVRTTGSHVRFRHPVEGRPCSVPHPKADLPIGTLKSIEKQSGLRLR